MCLCVRQSWACPSDNSSTVQARITKFGPEKQNTLVKIPIVFFGNWPWPSRSNLTSNSKLTPFWACPNHYSPPILVRISKLGQEMHFSTVKIPVNPGLDWPWTSPSFLIPKLIFLHCGGVHWDCETVPGLFQFCSGTVSKSLHQCTWGTHSQSGMGPLVRECLIWIKQNRHLDYCRCQSRSAAGPKLPPMQASPGYRSTNPSLAAATRMRRDRHPSGADVNTWKYGGPCSAALLNQFYLKFLLLQLC